MVTGFSSATPENFWQTNGMKELTCPEDFLKTAQNVRLRTAQWDWQVRSPTAQSGTWFLGIGYINHHLVLPSCNI
jgi:hypothetical protein